MSHPQRTFYTLISSRPTLPVPSTSPRACLWTADRQISTAEPPSDEFLDREELEFVAGFDALMSAAHYNLLSKQEWETAEKEEFTVRRVQLLMGGRRKAC